MRNDMKLAQTTTGLSLKIDDAKSTNMQSENTASTHILGRKISHQR
jgi:hypothetical protein